MRVIQPSSKRIGRFLEVPNLIELQLNSYRWFLEEGLPELFQTFSPIWDFTQTNYIELVSFSLGEPKYSLQECRDRDMTFEAPIKGIVRFGGRDREVIESEVYLGDLPLMTDKGTFIINGRERVIVSQLSRSPGLYFEEGVDSSMQVLVSARIIPNEGPWLEVESDANLVVRTQISQTKKLPLTQMIKALSGFDKGRTTLVVPLKRAMHRRLVEPIADPETGEVLHEAGTLLTKDILDSLPESVRSGKFTVETPLMTNDDLLFTFGKEIELNKERTSIGRKPNNDIQIDNLAISGQHAVITCILNDAFLEDQNSTNGTYVNGQPVKKHVLQHNDAIELGKYRIKYIVEAVQPGKAASDMIDTVSIKPFALSAATSDADDGPANAPTATQILAAGALERAQQAGAAKAGRVGIIQVLSGTNSGRELELTKSLTTLGKPGRQVAVITRRPHGYFITHVEGASFPLVNGVAIGAQAHLLKDHDIIDLAGVKMEFFLRS